MEMINKQKSQELARLTESVAMANVFRLKINNNAKTSVLDDDTAINLIKPFVLVWHRFLVFCPKCISNT